MNISEETPGHDILQWGALIALIVETCVVVVGIISAFVASASH